MNLACVGISHLTAPLGMREQLWFSDQEILAALPQVKALGFTESVLISTPSRTELYASSDQTELTTDSLIEFLRHQKHVQENVPAGHFFSHAGRGAAEHLFSLAAGIDSMIVGDVEILTQVKASCTLAQSIGAAGPLMKKLFESAFRCSDRSRSETMVSEGAISVSHAAVELAQHIFDELNRKKALIIGGGETVQLTAQRLLERGIGLLYVTHPVAERAENLAKSLSGIPLTFDTFREKLSDIDIVLSSLQAAPFVLATQDIKKVGKGQRSSTLFLIDLGTPRNIDPFAKELEQVFLYDLDTLNVLVSENIARRRAEVPKTQSIIAEELSRLTRSMKLWASP